jgi:uncharacterized OB-fold protein
VTRPPQRGIIPPDTDTDSAGWWAALRSGRVEIYRCVPSGHYYFPPQPRCPKCGTRTTEPVDADGRGIVHSWIVVHRALDEAFADDTPYTIVAVNLDEGPRMFGRIANGPLETGQRVRAVPYTVEGTTLLGFEHI